MSAYLGALCAFMASVTWAFASTHYSAVTRVRGALPVGLARALVASTLWLSWLALHDGVSSLAQVGWSEALVLTGSILCSYVVGDRVFFAASAQLGVPSALAIAAIYPLWAALYGALVRAEPLGPRRMLGIVGCVAGVSAVLWMSREPGKQRARALVVGGALALLTSLFWAGNAVLLKQGTDALSIYQANGFRYSVGLGLMAVQVRRGSLSRVSPRVLLRELWLPLLLDAGLGSALFVYGIAHSDLALGATLSSLSPLVALGAAFVLGSERVTWGKLISVCLTLAGVFLLVTTA